MKTRWLMGFWLVTGLFWAKESTGGPSKIVKFDLAVDSGLYRHVKFLQSPAYLVVVLENLGAKFRDMQRIEFVDDTTLRLVRRSEIPFRTATARFVRQEGSDLLMELSIDWNLRPFHQQLSARVNVDVAKMKEGFITIGLDLSSFPDFLVAEAKDALRRDPPQPVKKELQDALVSYLDRLPPGGEGNFVLIDFFNRTQQNPHPVVTVSRGKEPFFSDQLLLLGTVVIHGFSFLGFLIFRWAGRRKRKPRPA